jgi:hypothetical protein
MSVFIKGGYYAVSKQLLNITLRPTTLWHNGIILTNKNKVISTLNPQNENKLELIKYNDISVLLLNNSIIYENKFLFNYNLDLSLTDDDFIFNKDRFRSCVNYQFIKCVNYEINNFIKN